MTSTLATTARSLIPDELLEGYGFHVDNPLPGGWLIRPAEPLYAQVIRDAGYPSPARIRLGMFITNGRRNLIWEAAFEAIQNGIGRAKGFTSLLIHPNPAFVFRWRAIESSDLWKEVPGEFLGVSVTSSSGEATEGTREIQYVWIKDFRLDPTSVYYDAGAPDLPADLQSIEFFLIGTMPPDELHPVVIEGLSAGQFVKNVYDGVYSPRDPVTGAIVPTKIRYDEATLLSMTDVVRIRLDEPIEEARDWLQKHIYAPTGWVPALDKEGRVSPMYQGAPISFAGLSVVHDAITEAVPDWNGGKRVYNVIRFTYFRDYSVGPPDPPPETAGQERQNLLEERSITLEYRDEESVARNGEQVLELSGEAFRAIGRDANPVEEEEVGPVVAPGVILHPRSRHRITNSEPIVRPTPVVVPVTGTVEDEKGYQLWAWRVHYLIPRYRFGAPTVRIPVMREELPLLRAGEFVRVLLAWFPDYVIERRGLEALGQVIGINDLDCAWRYALIELVPLPSES